MEAPLPACAALSAGKDTVMSGFYRKGYYQGSMALVNSSMYVKNQDIDFHFPDGNYSMFNCGPRIYNSGGFLTIAARGCNECSQSCHLRILLVLVVMKNEQLLGGQIQYSGLRSYSRSLNMYFWLFSSVSHLVRHLIMPRRKTLVLKLFTIRAVF